MKKITLKVMIANAQGNVEAKLAKEQRVLNHSKLIPTGFFVKKEQKSR